MRINIDDFLKIEDPVSFKEGWFRNQVEPEIKRNSLKKSVKSSLTKNNEMVHTSIPSLFT